MLKKPWSARKKTGVLSTAITVVVVACLILLNAAAGAITKQYPVKIDLTANQVFQLSQESIDYIGNLNKEIKMTVMNSREGFLQSGSDYYKQALSVMDQYVQHNHNIKLEFVDLASNPTFVANYPDLDLTVNDILVECGDRKEKLTAYDIFSVEQSWYGGSITASTAEQAMTGAIMNVASEEKVKVAFITGHQESDSSALETLLQKNGFETVSVSSVMEPIPEDAQMAVLAAPLRDLTADETARLDTFLSGGEGEAGKSLLYFASESQPSLPTLEKWLEKWGLGVGQGVVAETDQNRVLSNNAFFGIANLDDTGLTGFMRDSTIPLTMPFSRPVELLFSSNMGYTTSTLLSFSESAGIVTENITQASDIKPSGPIPVAGMSTYQNGPKTSHVVAFGSEHLFNSQMMDSSSLSNQDYLLSVANTLCQRTDVFSVAPKVLGGGALAITQAQVFGYSLLLMIVLPIAVLAAGITIWIKRKHR